MSGCCEGGCALEADTTRQRRTLIWVLLINLCMFVVVACGALYGRSSALLADSLDNLGDALTYAISLYAVGKAARVKAKVALLKGSLILTAAVAVALQVAWRWWQGTLPSFELMGIFSVLALLANGVCLYLLTRHRDEDINMRSVWECSRNDVATNLAVLLTAGLVWWTGSAWPDLLVAMLLVVLLLRSALRIIKAARAELRQPPVVSVELPQVTLK